MIVPEYHRAETRWITPDGHLALVFFETTLEKVDVQAFGPENGPGTWTRTWTLAPNEVQPARGSISNRLISNQKARSGKRDLNSRRPPWQGGRPLNHLGDLANNFNTKLHRDARDCTVSHPSELDSDLDTDLDTCARSAGGES